MKVPGAVYHGKKGKYLALYSYQHDVCLRLPPELRECRHLAHVSYSRGRKKGGVDLFDLQDRESDLERFVSMKKSFFSTSEGVEVRGQQTQKQDEVEEEIEEGGRFELASEKIRVQNSGFVRRVNIVDIHGADEVYDIRAEVVRDCQTREFLDLCRGDIVDFCRDNFANEKRGSAIEVVDSIVPVTSRRLVIPERMITGGKQWFFPSCLLEGNIDFGKGCVTSWVPGVEHASFDGTNFRGFFAYYWGECEICYAGDKHKCFPKTLYEFDRSRLREELNGRARLEFESDKELGRKLKILRFGKRTEAWTPWTREQFIATLEEMTQTGTRGIIPTKAIPFDPELARLFKKTNSAVLFDQGFDEFELGAVEHGWTNQWRLEQAMKYREAGVNSVLYLLITGIQPAQARELAILERAGYGSKIPIQLLPMRFRRKGQVERVTGLNWHYLKSNGPKGQLALGYENFGSYVLFNHELVPRVHDYWRGLIQDNHGRIRMCHHDDTTFWCGGCYQSKGMISEHR